MEYLGLTIDTREMTVKIPDKKMKELLVLIREVAFSKKVTLKKLQSLCGVLAFCTRAIPAGRALSRRLYMTTSKAKKPFHLIRITKEIKSSKSSLVIQTSDVILNHTDISVSVTINSSKTDQYGLKTKLVLNSEFVNLSLYDQLHQYLSVRPSINGSFFCHFNHEKVTRYQVTVILKSALRFLGYNENDYNTHFFVWGLQRMQQKWVNPMTK